MRRFLSTAFLSLAAFCTKAQQPAPNVPGNPFQTRAQVLVRTGEDSLQQGFGNTRTVISGYGSAFFQRDFYLRQNTAALERVVLFVGHQFNSKFAFFSELELENAVVSNAGNKGELAMEQAYIRYNINPSQYLVAGLFIPRIGILNENHLPVNFNGTERPLVEQLVIPATWRELGVGWYGQFGRAQFSAGLINGLNSQNMQHGDGIRSGRNEGFLAGANNAALTGSAAYSLGDFRVQASGYVGGTTGLRPRLADSLALDGGAFGMPLFLGEANVQWSHGPFAAKALGVMISFPEAGRVNAAFAKNLPTRITGGYAELSYDVLYTASRPPQAAQLLAFARLEAFDLNARIPAPPRGIPDATLRPRHLLLGLNFMPTPGLTFKADVRLQNTGPQNPELIINPAPNALPYQQDNTFLNVGVGYSF